LLCFKSLDLSAFRSSGVFPVVGKGRASGDASSLGSLLFALRRTLMRHTKGQTFVESNSNGSSSTTSNGQKLLELPPKTTTTQTLTFNAREQSSYASLESAAKAKYLALRWCPALVAKHTIKLLAAMVPLRQACSGGEIPTPEEAAESAAEPEATSSSSGGSGRAAVVVSETKLKALVAALRSVREKDATSKCLVFSQVKKGGFRRRNNNNRRRISMKRSSGESRTCFNKRKRAIGVLNVIFEALLLLLLLLILLIWLYDLPLT
jgi:hypothetical protein